MKCEHIITTYVAVLSNGSEMTLKRVYNNIAMWKLDWDKDGIIPTVSEIYDVAKSILEKSDENVIDEILVDVFDLSPTINRKTTREEFLNNLIGNVSVDAITDINRA